LITPFVERNYFPHTVEQHAGPSSGFSSRGAKNQKGDYIFKIQYWMYVATGEPNVKWGDTDFK